MARPRWSGSLGIVIPYLLTSPTLLYLATFVGIPLVQAILLVFYEPGKGLTLEHVMRVVHYYRFLPALINTFLLAAIIIPLQLAMALIIALLVNTRFYGSSVFLYICAIPIAISDLAAALIWYSIFAYRGYLNAILYNLGLIKRPLLYLSHLTLPSTYAAIIITEVWRATAIVMLIIVAGLQMISKDYLETADLFGASTLQKLRMVILPLLKPSIQSALIIRTLFAMQVFAVVITLGGELVPVLASEAYTWQSAYFDTRAASVYALLIAAISVVLTGIYLKVLKPAYEVGRE